MGASILAVALALVGIGWTAQEAQAEEVYYKWRDAQGRWHYSNVASPKGTKVFDFTGTTSPSLNGPPLRADSGRRSAAKAIERHQLRQSARRVQRELQSIAAFFSEVRERQRARLAAAAVHQILEDWQVADRGMELRRRRRELYRELQQIREAEQQLEADQATAPQEARVPMPSGQLDVARLETPVYP